MMRDMRQPDATDTVLTDFAEALDCLHASNAWEDEVRARAAKSGRRPRRRGAAVPLALAVALALVVVAATGGVAYAVASNPFFQEAFGGHGLSGRQRVGGTDEASVYTDFEPVDPAAISDDVAGAVEDVNLSVEGNGFTLTLGQMIVDENGCGSVTFKLTNPDGIAGVLEYGGNGAFVPTSDKGGPGTLDLVTMQVPDPAYWDSEWSLYGNSISERSYYDVDSVTDTSLNGTMYFNLIPPRTEASQGAVGPWAPGEAIAMLRHSGVRWRLCWHDGDEQGNTVEHEALSDVFKPSSFVSARTFTAGDQATVSVSPFSMVVTLGDGPTGGSRDEWLVDRLVLTMADGSTEVVEDDVPGTSERVFNTYYSFGSNVGNQITYLFVNLLDTSQVVSVDIAGRSPDASDNPEGDEGAFSLTLTPEG